MKSKQFFILAFKKNFLTIIFTSFLICLIVFSKNNLQASKNGLLLWAKNVVPSLFPFFIATELLNYTKLPYFLGKLTNKFMRPLFNVPGEASYAFIMGIVSGYPVGAQIVNNFYENNICTKKEAERMLAFTNNSSPLFIIGTVGVSLFGYSKIGLILFFTHILSCITVGIILGFFSKKNTNKFDRLYVSDKNVSKDFYNISDLGYILSNSITNATSTILLIGGFIVLFSIIISILNSLNIIDYISSTLSILGLEANFIKGLIIGLIELTNGVSFVSSLHVKNMSYQILITAFLLGFAGISIFLQIFSITSKNKLSMKPYLIGKFLQGLISTAYTFMTLHCFSFLNLNIVLL